MLKNDDVVPAAIQKTDLALTTNHFVGEAFVKVDAVFVDGKDLRGQVAIAEPASAIHHAQLQLRAHTTASCRPVYVHRRFAGVRVTLPVTVVFERCPT